MKRIVAMAGLSLCLLACTSTRPPATVTLARGSESVKQQPGCVQTGSRVPDDCAAIGRKYDQRDIRTTGQTDASAALRMLDPTVSAPGR